MIGVDISRDLRLPLVPVVQQLLLVVQQLLVRLRRELEIGALDDRVDGTRLLAESAIDALRHVDVVAGGPSRAVRALFSFNRDGLCHKTN